MNHRGRWALARARRRADARWLGRHRFEAERRAMGLGVARWRLWWWRFRGYEMWSAFWMPLHVDGHDIPLDEQLRLWHRALFGPQE